MCGGVKGDDPCESSVTNRRPAETFLVLWRNRESNYSVGEPNGIGSLVIGFPRWWRASRCS